MADALGKLIRLHRRQLDEKRRALVQQEAELAALNDRLDDLEAERDREQTLSRGDLDMARAFPAYLARYRARRADLVAAITAKQAAVEQARAVVAEAFQEVKRYEIALENREKREEAERNRAEQALLDELGLDAFRRAQSGSGKG